MQTPPSMQDILKAVENLQSNMQKTQDHLAQTKVIGTCETSENNAITMEFTGQYECKNIHIPDTFPTFDKSQFEQMLMTSINNAMQQIKSLTHDQIETLSEDLKGQDT